MEFILCILQYLIIMVVLAAVGAAGGFIGVRLRKSKDAKTANAVSEHTNE